MKSMKLYEDMLDMDYPIASPHVPMELEKRAAQFAPFAALTGYEEVIREANRYTCAPMELDENNKQELDVKLQDILHMAGTKVCVQIEYFVPDEKKVGGAYCKVEGVLKKIDSVNREIVLMDGTRIGLECIIDISTNQTVFI